MADTNGHRPALPQETLRTMALALTRLTLAGRMGQSFDGMRDFYDLFGWKRALRYLDFKGVFLRQGVGHRVVKAYPDAAWAQAPAVKEPRPKAPRRRPVALPAPVVEAPGVDGTRQTLVMNVGEDEETPFETAWTALATRLNLFSTLHRADMLANLGQYAVVLLGLANQDANLQTPAQPVRSPEDVLYLIPYSEEFASIETFEDNPNVPEYAQPKLYRLHTGGLRAGTTATSVSARQLLVHASRVIHIAVTCLDDEVYGIPRLEPIFNNVWDIEKLLGSSAEMFFRDAKRRIGLTLREGYEIGESEAATLAQKAEEFQHGMRDFLDVMGMDIVNLPGTTASPADHLAAQLDIVSMATRIPKRILLGSERGELSSSQDAEEWKQTITQYQQQIAEQRILRPLIDQLIALKALPAPVRPYEVQWENLFSLSEEKQAQVAKDVATALNLLAQARMNGMRVPSDERFLDAYLHLDPEDDPWAVELPAEGLMPGEEEL